MNITKDIAELLESHNDKLFFERAYGTPASVYISRLKAISFSGLNKVCDIGCGYGHWTFPLSKLNQTVHGVDISVGRVSLCKELLAKNPEYNGNIEFSVKDMQKTGYPDQYFDGVFSYSVIYHTDYRKSLKEIHRILRPGGKLYISTNDIGWYFYNIIERPNMASDYDPRADGLRSISKTYRYYSSGEYEEEGSLVMPMGLVIQEMERMGLNVMASGADGEINLSKETNFKPFYKKEYYGYPGPYEILAVKK